MLYLEILIVLALIVLNGFFSMSELAVVSARRTRLKTAARRGSRGAATALELANQPGTFLPTVQIGISLIGILAGAFGGATLADKLGAWLATFPVMRPFASGLAIAVVVAAITYLSLVIGELVPKQLALRKAESIAARVAMPLRMLATVTGPAVWLLRVSSDFALRILGVRGPGTQTVTEEEIRALVAEATETGVFERSEREIIERVLRLDDRSVQTIMTPRHDLVWIDVADDAATVGRKIEESGHSRFPLCKGSPDEVVGIIQSRDLLPACLLGLPFSLTQAARQALVFHENTSALEALQLLKASPVHFALVVDEYGTVQGIVTITDVAQAIVGTIRETEKPEEPEAVRREDGSWLVDGTMSIPEVRHVIGIADLPEGAAFHTLAGFVMAELGRVPVEGDHFDWGDWRFEVVDMDGRRVDKVMLQPQPKPLVME